MSLKVDPLAGDPQPAPLDELHQEVQADVLIGGIPKRNESFLFFSIQSPKDFCQTLSLDTTLDLFKTTGYVANIRHYIKATRGLNLPDLSLAMANISFSAAGLKKMQSALPADTLGLTDQWMRRDRVFFGGMETDAEQQDASLGLKDPMDQWEDEYRGAKIDGLLLIAGSDDLSVRSLTLAVQNTFASSISLVKTESGAVRPGKYKGREHFGFHDSISQPTLEGVGPDNPKWPDGSVGVLGDKWNTVPQSVIVVQDANGLKRPKWTKHGSFLVFRKLEQDVGRWRGDITLDAGERDISVEKLAAKMMGRWFDGCPVMVNSAQDDITQSFNNQFDFVAVPRPNPFDAICPLGAHIRKMNPHRAQPHTQKGDVSKDGRILRRGIPYGPDYDTDPTNLNRGLYFVCYQSSIELGFRLCQRNWANFDDFPGPSAGIDTMTGNLVPDQESKMFIYNDDEGKNGRNFVLKDLNHFVKPRGGEYFFTPTLTALRETLSLRTS